ncbi:hypothetical protein TYRP_010036 [Tyrophagus putrescentiae]|nr:hypothetical protein TYRP_010036 [Tyrophagus putrescentiae]
MLRLIRSLFEKRPPESADAPTSDYSFESQQEGLLEDELQRAGDFYATYNRDSDVPVYGADQYDRTPSAAELAYYADYDPVIGYRIAVTLGILILLFIIFVLYKTHCHQQKNRRLTKNVAQQQQQQSQS